MKQGAVKIIEFYQFFISHFIRQFFGVGIVCRHAVSCSQYAKDSLKKYGIIKGTAMGAVRILSCQPFSRNVS